MSDKVSVTFIALPCTLRELESAIHRYGDHHGFDGKIEDAKIVGLDGVPQTVLVINEENTHGEETVRSQEG